MQQKLARTEGIYAEAASVTTLVAIEKLVRQGKISADEKVVAVITSSGLKDPASTASLLPRVPEISPDSQCLSNALKKYYGVNLF